MNREEEAWEELERSSISRCAKWILVISFLLLIVTVVVVDMWNPYGPRDAVRSFLTRSRPMSSDSSVIGMVNAWNKEVISDIGEFESQIEDESVLGKTIPYYQFVMAKWLQTSGTARVIIGRNQWYFLREGLESSLGWGDGESLREADGAVRRLAGLLSSRGIRLILVPVPGKVDLHPSEFSRRFGQDDFLPVTQPFGRYVDNWNQLSGVEVVPVRELLEELRNEDFDVFLERDTHWTPVAMMEVTNRLARMILADPLALYMAVASANPVSAPGDLVEMMRLPRPILAEQRVVADRMIGEPYGKADSKVIFLGDSFAAIYSDPVLGWGAGAGMQDWLPQVLGTRVDFRLNYGDPVSEPGRQLERILSSPDLENIPEVVIWEFSERFLYEGNWSRLFR
tara:strand:+ start:12044 stop:13234 length:1191 start_codon:yes stop_codon:yes gene_type:complete